jgi:hypothetical protein
MSTITLHVKGTGYGGTPSGTGGQEVEAETTQFGDYTEEIFYRAVSKSGLMDRLLHMSSSDWGVERAFVTSAVKSQLADIVQTDRSSVAHPGVSDYILYGPQQRQ